MDVLRYAAKLTLAIDPRISPYGGANTVEAILMPTSRIDRTCSCSYLLCLQDPASYLCTPIEQSADGGAIYSSAFKKGSCAEQFNLV